MASSSTGPGRNCCSDADLGMPEPDEGHANCCCDTDLDMRPEQSRGELCPQGSRNCWHETDLDIPPARWSRHRKEPGCVVGEQMHLAMSSFVAGVTFAGVSAILEAISRTLLG